MQLRMQHMVLLYWWQFCEENNEVSRLFCFAQMLSGSQRVIASCFVALWNTITIFLSKTDDEKKKVLTN